MTIAAPRRRLVPVLPLATLALLLLAACSPGDVDTGEATDPAQLPDTSTASMAGWETDFFDDFESFDTANWRDQLLWVNDEDQCYVRDGAHGTREVSDGTLKLRVVDLGEAVRCDNMDKFGNQHPPTPFVAGRISSKNRQEFVKGRWVARIRVPDSGQDGMFPAWWLLGARNNEPPVEEADEDVCWPLVGSGEIDIFEHHSDGGPDHYAARAIKSTGECGGGDWQELMHVQAAPLAEWHEYGVEWEDGDLVFTLDGEVIYVSEDQGDQFPEPLFAILNFAKINDAPMTTDRWTMEVDWVRHDRRVPGETASLPRFRDYPADTVFRGVPAAPLLADESSRRFASVLRNAAKDAPDFAGHLSVASWGCGTSCQQQALIDARDGTVHMDAPTTSLGAEYRPDSRLMVANIPEEVRARCIPEADREPRSVFYVWTGSTLAAVDSAGACSSRLAAWLSEMG